jgi:hypothetical protein
MSRWTRLEDAENIDDRLTYIGQRLPFLLGAVVVAGVLLVIGIDSMTTASNLLGQAVVATIAVAAVGAFFESNYNR